MQAKPYVIRSVQGACCKQYIGKGYAFRRQYFQAEAFLYRLTGIFLYPLPLFLPQTLAEQFLPSPRVAFAHFALLYLPLKAKAFSPGAAGAF